MKFDPKLIIGGVELPLPDDYTQAISDLVSSASERNLQGKAVKHVVAVKSTVSFKFSDIEWKKAAAITNAIDGCNKITAKILDVRKPYQHVTVDMYVNDRNCTPKRFDTDGKVYWDIEFKEIEL